MNKAVDSRRFLPAVYPFLFSIFCCLVYVIAYHSVWQSAEATTLIILFFGALGAATAVRDQPTRPGRWSLLVQVSSVVIPLLYTEWWTLTVVNQPWHRLMIGLNLFGLLAARLYRSHICR